MKTTKWLQMSVTAFSLLTIGMMSLSPSVSYGTPSTEEAARAGARAGAAAGRKAAQDDNPEEEKDEKEEGGCCGG